MVKQVTRIFLVLIGVGMIVSDSFAVGAGGLTDQIVDAKVLGQGNVFVAQADNPSAIYFNPAGMIQMPGLNLSIGSTVLRPVTDHSGSGISKDSMKKETSVVPNFYLTSAFLDGKLGAGLGLHSAFGLATEWSNTGFAKYVATKSEFKMYTVNPAVAYKVSPKLAVGFGVDFVQLYKVNLKRQLNLTVVNTVLNGGVPSPTPDGTAELSGDGKNWGYNLGLLYKPTKEHQLGLSYRSQVRPHVEGSLTFKDLSGIASALFGGQTYTTGGKTDFTFPQSLLLGYAYKPNDKWTFEADYEWTDWSVFQNTSLTFAETNPTRLALLNTGNPTPRDWRDGNAFGLGVNRKISDSLDLRGGYFYYTKVAPNRTFEPSIPDSSRHGLTLGAGYKMGPVTLDLAYLALIFEAHSIDNAIGASSLSSVDGKYETFSNFFAVNVAYKFK